MNQVFFFALLLLAVVFANILNRHIKVIPLPFFLIGLGILLVTIPNYRHFNLDPSVFSFAIIAPLLFNEGQNASRFWIGKTLGNILSLAVGLVLVTVVVLGFSIHALFPLIPLSLAFALVAVVTPTDASAVNAINETNPLPTDQMRILSNESLFNDAAGIVAFTLALDAFTSGQFSMGVAIGDFLYVFFGGMLLGGVLGTLIVSFRSLLIRWNDDEPVIMVTLQLITPLLVYFIAEELNFSGILAVVAAGLAQGVERDRLGLASARMQIVTTNVWQMVSGILSGMVFVLLGVELPDVLQFGLTDQFWQLVLIGVFIYVAKLVIRWIWARYLVHVPQQATWRDSLVIALSGASGTITLSLAFSIPDNVASGLRTTLIFVAAVVILISLVLPPIFMPLLLPKKASPENNQHIWVRRMISAGIDAVRGEKVNIAEAQIVEDTLSQQLILDDNPNRRRQNNIFNQAIAAEKKAVADLFKQGKMTKDEAYYYNEFIDLNNFTADQHIWKNLWLRMRFTFHMGAMYRSVEAAQTAFLTTPINLEPIFWKRQFIAHHEDIIPIEQAGFDAAMAILNQLEASDNRAEVNNVRRFYRNRHRRILADGVDGNTVYQLFLTAFHAEFTLVQDALNKKQISSSLAERLQQRITFDEMTYLQNQDVFKI